LLSTERTLRQKVVFITLDGVNVGKEGDSEERRREEVGRKRGGGSRTRGRKRGRGRKRKPGGGGGGYVLVKVIKTGRKEDDLAGKSEG